MRRDRSVDSVVTADSSDADLVGYFNDHDIARGLVSAFAAAVRTGIPVERMPHQTMFATAGTLTLADDEERRLEDLRVRIADADKRALRAKTLSLDPEADEDEAKDYQVQARAARREASEARSALHALEKQIAEPQTPAAGPFDALTDLWLPALRALVENGGRVTQAQYQALRVVMPEFSMRPVDGLWWGSARFRVNTTDGVATLGPVTWLIGAGGGRGSSAFAANTSARVRDRRSRRELKAILTDKGQLTADAAATALSSPFPQLPAMLAHLAAGQPLPEWVSEQWTAEPFAAWLKQIYCNPRWCWLGNGKYAITSPRRQLIVDYAQKNVSFTAAEAVRDLPLPGREAVATLARATAPGANGRSWLPAVQVLPPAGARVKTFGPVLCRCGEPAAISVRIPEVPADLLCRCGRTPPRGNAMPDDVVFPDEYQQLRMPADHAVAVERLTMQRRPLPAQHRKLLSLETLLHQGATADELGTALAEGSGRPTRVGAGASIWGALQRLEDLQLIRRDAGRPARWTRTEVPVPAAPHP